MDYRYSKALLLWILLQVTSIMLPSTALANGMPSLLLPDSPVGSVIPLIETPVAIASEKLTIIFDERKQPFFTTDLVARVTAQYRLSNPTTQTLTVPVFFIAGHGGSNWEVDLNGAELELPEITAEQLSLNQLIDSNEEIPWTDPYTGKPYNYTSSRIKEPGGQSFNLTLSPGIHQLQVSYLDRPGYDGNRYANKLFYFSYLLQPARHWADFANLNVTVRTPNSWYKLDASLPLSQTEPGLWEGYYAKLPERDLHLSLISSKGMWLGRYTSRNSLWLLLLAAVLIPGYFNKLLRNRLPVKTGLIIHIGLHFGAGLFAWVTLLRHQVIDYPLNMVVQAPLVIGVTLYLLYDLVRGMRYC